MEEETKKKNTNFFTDADGNLSMRRLLAFLLTVCSMCVLIACIFVEFSWQVLAAGSGIPLLGALIMMFFTSWSDIAAVASAMKK